MTTKNSFKATLKLEIQDSTYYTLTTVLTQFGNFLVIPLFWKVLTPTDYGILAITEIISTFLSVILGLSLDQSITRFYYEWPEEERRRRIGAIWVMNWGSVILLGGGSMGVFYLISPLMFPQVGFFPVIFLGLLNAIFLSLTPLAQATIRIKKMPKLYATYRVTTFFLQIAISIYFVLVHNWGLVGYLSALVISSLVAAIFSGVIMTLFGVPCLINAGIKDALRFSVPMIPSACLSSFTSILDRLILQHFCSLQVLGIYAIALKFTSIIGVVQNSLKLSYGPFFMKNVLTENGRQAIYRMTGFYIFPLFLAGLSLSVFIDKAIYLIGQPSYYPVIEFVPYLVIVTLIGCLNVFYANGIILSNRTHLLIFPALLQLCFLFIGMVLIPRLEIFGAIIAKFLSITSFVVASVFISNRVYKLQYNWSRLIVFASMMLFGIFINMFISTDILTLNILISTVIVGIFSLVSYRIFKADISDTESIG